MQVVWFKRDLRVVDHAPLVEAVATGEVVLPLYILEPELWRQPDMGERHYRFLLDSLMDLNAAVEALTGASLVVRVGDAVGVLEQLREVCGFSALWSHQETWNGWTYRRDVAVQRWARERGVVWEERRQFGVVRRLRTRDGWSRQWNFLMAESVLPAPVGWCFEGLASDALPSAGALGLEPDGGVDIQRGGRERGLSVLETFLNERGETYTKGMSSPVTAFDVCSRLSPHLSFGDLSMREVYRACRGAAERVKALPRGQKGKWPSAYRSFAGRLRWHCHFMQKLEDAPRIEFENFHSAYDGLWDPEPDVVKLAAWKAGRTGYPMVDACMRALTATGWLNFRMRAMLMSFASYHLWLNWREPALHLARLFTDYEPGIHYSQVQMQSGTTGINTIRIYNPIKQGLDQDPEGVFIRRWVPELRDFPLHALHQPWALPHLLNGYPMPIVEEAVARRAASSRLYALRKGESFYREAGAIVEKHGSRQSSERPRRGAKGAPGASQGELDLEL